MRESLVAIRLARRELRGGIKGFRIFLACLSLGVGAIAAVGSISAAIVGGLAKDGQSILGGDAAIRITHRDLEPAQREWLGREGRVSRSVYMRAMARASGAGRNAGGDRSLIDLKAVDGGYPLFGAVKIEPAMPLAKALAARDGAWGAVADRALLERLGLKLGDTVRVGDIDFQLRATLVHEPDRHGGVRPIVLGPRFMIADGSLPDTGLIRQGSQVRYLHRVRLAADVDLRDWRRRLEAAFPDAPWSITDRTNASPAVKRFVDRTAMFMTLIGLTALLVGGVGISNAIGGFLNGKMATIATFKGMGAPSSMIFEIYYTQILAMAAVGIAAGLGLGVAAPYAMAAVFPENELIVAGLGFHLAPLALAAVFGFLTTTVFSLWPLGRACATRPAALFRDTVTQHHERPSLRYIVLTAATAIGLAALAVMTAYDKMIALWFVSGVVVAMCIFWTAGLIVVEAARRARFRRTTVRLAVANLHRPGATTAAVVMSLGLGLTVLVAIALIDGNMRHQIMDELPDKAPSYFFIDIQPDQVAGFDQAVHRMDAKAELQRTPMLRGRITAVNGVPSEKVRAASNVRWALRGDRGITWSATPPEGSRVVAGKWWPTEYKGPPLVSIAANVAKGLGVGLGDTLTLNILGRPLTAKIASLREIRWGSLRMNFVIVLSPGVIESAPQTHLATVRAADGPDRRIERAVTDRFPNITAIRVKDVLETVNHFLQRLSIAVRMTASVTIAAGILVLAGAIAAGHRRRVYEAVVLKVLGATRRRILTAFVIEFAILGVATAIIAAILGTIGAWAVLTYVMRTEWIFQPSVVVWTVMISTGITLGFGLLGSWRALSEKAAGHLRNE